MDEKIDKAIQRAISDKTEREKTRQSDSIQIADFWNGLITAVKQGVERINQDPVKMRVAGGQLECNQLNERGYDSASEFSIMTDSDPGRRIRVLNANEYLSVQVMDRKVHEDRIRETPKGSPQKLQFQKDELGLFVGPSPKFHDPQVLAVYLIEKFWTL